MYYPIIKKDILFETTTPNEFKKIMGKKNKTVFGIFIESIGLYFSNSSP